MEGEFPRDWFEFVANFADAKRKGIVVKNHRTGEEWVIGSPGMNIFSMFETVGDFRSVESMKGRHIMRILLDAPTYIPVPDGNYKAFTERGEFVVSLAERHRGQETFSSIDTNLTPIFSALEITVNDISLDPLLCINEVLQFFDELLGQLGEVSSGLHKMNRFSVIVEYRDITRHSQVVARRCYPLTGMIALGNKARTVTEAHQLAAGNAIRLKLREKALGVLHAAGKASFQEKVLHIIHDAAWVCRQHSSVVQELNEEPIRDLMLIPLKVVFPSAEGESFNFSGRADVKITNPESRYEFIIVEIKWWKADASAVEVYSQAFREHVTGQESCIVVVFLCSNLDQKSIQMKVIELLKQQPEYIELDQDTELIEHGEWFRRGKVRVQGNEIPFVLGMMALHYKNVRQTA